MFHSLHPLVSYMTAGMFPSLSHWLLNQINSLIYSTFSNCSHFIPFYKDIQNLIPGVTLAPWGKFLRHEFVNHKNSNHKYEQVLTEDFFYIWYNQKQYNSITWKYPSRKRSNRRNSDSYILLINLKYVSSWSSNRIW